MMFKIWAHLSYFLNDFKVFLVLIFASFVFLIYFANKIFKSRLSEESKKKLIAAFFALFLLILIFSGFEAYFRYRYDQSDGLGFLDTNVRWMARHVVFNTYGYRDRDFQLAKKAGVIRIGVVGDSLAMGYGIKNVNNRFSNLLEKKLNDHGFKTEVFNMGVSGLDTCSEIIEFNRVKQLNFDLIVWEYYPNDIQPCKGSTGGSIILKRFNSINPVMHFFLDQSFFFDYAYWKLSPTYGNTFRDLRIADLSQFTNSPVLRMHLDDVATFSAVLQQNTTTHKVVVVVFPFLFLLNKNYPAAGIHHTMDAYFKKQNDEVIDLEPYLVKTKNTSLMVNNFDSHPNEYVHALAADKLYDKIVPIVKSLRDMKK